MTRLVRYGLGLDLWGGVDFLFLGEEAWRGLKLWGGGGGHGRGVGERGGEGGGASEAVGEGGVEGRWAWGTAVRVEEQWALGTGMGRVVVREGGDFQFCNHQKGRS